MMKHTYLKKFWMMKKTYLKKFSPMKIFHHDSNEHVQNKEANKKEERYEVDETPFVVVLLRLLVQPDSVQAVVHYVDPTVL